MDLVNQGNIGLSSRLRHVCGQSPGFGPPLLAEPVYELGWLENGLVGPVQKIELHGNLVVDVLLLVMIDEEVRLPRPPAEPSGEAGRLARSRLRDGEPRIREAVARRVEEVGHMPRCDDRLAELRRRLKADGIKLERSARGGLQYRYRSVSLGRERRISGARLGFAVNRDTGRVVRFTLRGIGEAMGGILRARAQGNRRWPQPPGTARRPFWGPPGRSGGPRFCAGVSGGTARVRQERRRGGMPLDHVGNDPGAARRSPCREPQRVRLASPRSGQDDSVSRNHLACPETEPQGRRGRCGAKASWSRASAPRRPR